MGQLNGVNDGREAIPLVICEAKVTKFGRTKIITPKTAIDIFPAGQKAGNILGVAPSYLRNAKGVEKKIVAGTFTSKKTGKSENITVKMMSQKHLINTKYYNGENDDKSQEYAVRELTSAEKKRIFEVLTGKVAFEEPTDLEVSQLLKEIGEGMRMKERREMEKEMKKKILAVLDPFFTENQKEKEDLGQEGEETPPQEIVEVSS